MLDNICLKIQYYLFGSKYLTKKKKKEFCFKICNEYFYFLSIFFLNCYFKFDDLVYKRLSICTRKSLERVTQNVLCQRTEKSKIRPCLS